MLPQHLVLQLATVALLATPLLLTSARAMQKATPHDASAGVPPRSVLAFDQKLNGKKVTIAYAHIPADGYVAVYGSDADGKRVGKALGYVPLAKGDHRDVAVDLTSAPKAGTALWAALYRDVDGDKKLDATKDTPFWQELPHENRFEVEG